MNEKIARAYMLSANFTLWEFLYSKKAEQMGLMGFQYEIPELYILNLKKLCENVLYFGFLCGIIFVLVVILSDKRFRTTMWYLYRSAMRLFTGIFIQLNPIAILEGYIEDLNNKMTKINEQLDLIIISLSN